MRLRNLFALGFAFLTLSNFAKAEIIYGLTNFQQIVTFDSNTRAVTATQSIAGFSTSGVLLLSIDVRPLTGELYGVGNDKQIYTINLAAGTSTAIGSPLVTGGAIRGIDFNPTVDRIRVITANDENFRLFPTTALAGGSNLVVPATPPDGNLAFAAGDSNAGDNPDIAAFAYTNSFAGASTTTLYDLDALNDILTTQIPPNTGTLNTVGSIGLNVVSSSGFTGFDISGSSGTAYLVGNALLGGGPTSGSLYTLNLASGAATLAGPITGLSGSFRDIAVAPVPEPSTFLLIGAAIGAIAVYRRKK